jgi:hypothetical protein
MARGLAISAVIAAVLVLFGALTTHGFLAAGEGRLGVLGVLAVLAGYALAGLCAAPALARRDATPLAVAARLAPIAAGVYVLEVLAEYAVLPADNTLWGGIEFGLVFLVVAAAGAVAAWRTGRLSAAALGGVWTAMAAALVWYVAVLAVFYLFRGSARQAAVLRAEGDFDDFRRSGESSLQLFLMGDFLGAGFFHLALSPLIGAALGAVGGALGLAARWARRAAA